MDEEHHMVDRGTSPQSLGQAYIRVRIAYNSSEVNDEKKKKKKDLIKSRGVQKKNLCRKKN